jgi:hypothetical protein
MSKLCPKCDLGSDDNAAFCRWCGGDLRAVEGGSDPPVGALPPTEPSQSVPPGWPPPPTPGYPPPPAPGYPVASDGAPVYGIGNLPPSIPTHLVWAILSTIMCCTPLGIVSIVYAAQVNTHLFRGDIPRAQRLSRLARNWAIVSIVVSVVGWIIYGIAVAVFGVGALGRLHF